MITAFSRVFLCVIYLHLFAGKGFGQTGIDAWLIDTQPSWTIQNNAEEFDPTGLELDTFISVVSGCLYGQVNMDAEQNRSANALLPAGLAGVLLLRRKKGGEIVE